MISCFILLLYAYTISGIGFDAGGGDRASCGRPYRAGRLYQPSCDLARLGYCAHAGHLYPWRAVKRFVKDNQGLMRRMYGDQRHGHVLRVELDDLDDFEEAWEKKERERGGYGHWRPTPVRFARFQHHDEDIDNNLDEGLDFDDFDNSYDEEPRYLKDDLANEDVLNTKFVISEQEAAIAIKLAELKAAAHFRPVSHRNQYTTPRTTTTVTSTTQQKPTTTRNVTKLIPTTLRKETTTAKVEDLNVIGGSEATTVKYSTTSKLTTASPTYGENTEELTFLTSSGSTTEPSTTDTTTDRTTEWNSKKIPTTTTTTTTFPTTPETSQPSPDNEKLGENIAADSNADQSAEGSENSEIYSDIEGNLKNVDAANTPAMLFQDMEANNSKKKGTMNFNKMKGFNACPVKEEVVAPFWANNTRGEVLALLNMYPFEQYVHWEKCTYEHKQMYCREGCKCEQQYRLHRLLAYDPNNECRGIFSDWFRFPSCCVCKCYDIPPEFRVTSRSPRFQMSYPDDDEPSYEEDKYG